MGWVQSVALWSGFERAAGALSVCGDTTGLLVVLATARASRSQWRMLSAPALWWGWLALTRDIRYAEMALWGGVGTGLFVLIFGITIGSVVFRRRSGRIMEFAEST